nr:hypothetical protein [Tanacetum cinerariifolium]
MSNPYKNWLVQKQTALGKDSSNPLMADNLPKIVLYSTHHVTLMKSWLVQNQMALGKDKSNPLTVDSLLKTIWSSIHHHLTNEVLTIPGQTATGVNTPRNDEDILEIMGLTVFLRKRGGSDSSTTPPTVVASPRPIIIVATASRLTTATKGKQPARATSPTDPSKVERTEAEQLKIVLRRSRQETHISKHDGSSTDEGTGSKPGVPDVPSDDLEEEISWNSSDDEDVDDQDKGRDDNEGKKTDESDVDDDDDDEEEIAKRDEQEATESDSEDDDNGEEDQGLRISEEQRLIEEEEADELYRDSSSVSSFMTSMLNSISDAGVESIFTTASSPITHIQTSTPIMTLSTIATITTSSEAPIPLTTIPSVVLIKLLFGIEDSLHEPSDAMYNPLQPLEKVFANIRRVGKGFLVVETPLFKGMIVGQEIKEGGDAEEHVEDVTAALDACTALTRRVEHLEYDKVAQALEITKRKRRVKKLEKGNRVRVLKLQRLKRVGTSQRVDTLEDTVMDDASNQGRIIDELYKDDVVALMDDKEEDKKEEEAKEDEPAKSTRVPAATITVAPVRIDAAPSRRRKGVVIRDLKEELSTSLIIPADTKSKDKGKGIMTKEQMEEEESRALQSINETPAQKAAKRRKLNEEVEDLKRHLEIVPDEDDNVYTKATPLARKIHNLVKERFSTSKPKNFFDDFLLTTLGVMFEKPNAQAQV